MSQKSAVAASCARVQPHRALKEVVLGTAMMLMGENSRVIAKAVAATLKKINSSLPEGALARAVYDRTALVDSTIETVRKNLLEGALLMLAVLFVRLGNLQAALITACVIPLSIRFTVTGMVTNKIGENHLSLDALEFGLIVDGAVIIVENCMRRPGPAQRGARLAFSRTERFDIVLDATREVIRAASFGVFIIMVAYISIFVLTGVEEKCSTRWLSPW
jgi:cobalt-zinc-cadmium resistance protein CzcA